ncbi:MAG: glycosyltransferase family 39 protein [Archangium sp.]
MSAGQRAPWVCLVLCVAARIALAIGTEIYPDEAYYWTWSKHLQLAYFDHPGLIAWAIWIFGIRTSAIFFGLATLFGVYRLARALGADTTNSAWATALFASTPAANLLGTIATPDAPLLCFWVWTLVALVRDRPIATGVLWGLAMLSKYNGILLGAPILWFCWRKPLRVIAIGVIALIVTSPTIIWNAQHDWEGFRFQFTHGLGGGGSLNTFLEFVGGQFGMAGPLLLVLMIVWLAKGPRLSPLGLALIVPVLFFGYASIKARGEANWSAAAWIAGAIGVSMLPYTRWRTAALILNTVVIIAGVGVLLFPPRAIWGNPAAQKLHGWWPLRLAETEGVPVITMRYQLSALTTWHSGLPATTFAGRRSQYDLWERPKIPKGTDALWISEAWEGGVTPEVAEKFESMRDVNWITDERQLAHHHFIVVRLISAKTDL